MSVANVPGPEAILPNFLAAAEVAIADARAAIADEHEGNLRKALATLLAEAVAADSLVRTW